MQESQPRPRHDTQRVGHLVAERTDNLRLRCLMGITRKIVVYATRSQSQATIDLQDAAVEIVVLQDEERGTRNLLRLSKPSHRNC